MKYFKKLVGEHIYLSPMNTEDAEIYTKWLNDFNVTDLIGSSSRITSLEGEKSGFLIMLIIIYLPLFD